jgi:hypothetical protein
MTKRIKLGMRVSDIVTGYTGVAIAATEYLQGCRRITVQARVKEDGTVPDDCSFDEPQLEVVGRGILPPEEPSEESDDESGGPHFGSAPKRGMGYSK